MNRQEGEQRLPQAAHQAGHGAANVMRGPTAQPSHVRHALPMPVYLLQQQTVAVGQVLGQFQDALHLMPPIAHPSPGDLNIRGIQG